MRVRALLTLIAAVAAAAAVSGCGGSSGPAPGDSRPSSKLTTEKFSAELDEICKLNTLAAAAVGPPKSVPALIFGLEKLLPDARREYRDLESLRVPAQYGFVYRSFVSINKRELTLMVQLRNAAADDNAALISSIDAKARALNAPSDVDSHILHVNWCLSTVTGTTTTTTPAPTSTLAA